MSSGPDRVSGFELDSGREISLCSSLGSAYQLDGNHHGARDVLERALRVCEENNGKNSLQAAGIALKLGSSYRCVLQTGYHCPTPTVAALQYSTSGGIGGWQGGGGGTVPPINFLGPPRCSSMLFMGT